jgi:hypothetical protein
LLELAVPGTLAAVSFAELRAGDLDGALSWLWRLLDANADE